VEDLSAVFAGMLYSTGFADGACNRQWANRRSAPSRCYRLAQRKWLCLGWR